MLEALLGLYFLVVIILGTWKLIEIVYVLVRRRSEFFSRLREIHRETTLSTEDIKKKIRNARKKTHKK